MERLTERDANCADPKEIYGVHVKNHDYISAANRLADYEDTERMPEEVTALGKLFDYALEESKTLTEQLALLNRIRDLAEADRDGRLVVLPCKVAPIEAMERLRDELYEQDLITMEGLKKLNTLIGKCTTVHDGGADNV